MRVLLCGESWITHSLHIKGVDSFQHELLRGGRRTVAGGARAGRIEVESLPGHLVPSQFPALAGRSPASRAATFA